MGARSSSRTNEEVVPVKLLIALAATLAPLPALAQAYQCAIPTRLPALRPDLPDAKQPKRLLPIGGYTLAISWSPEYCRGHAGEAGSAFQCGGGNRFGFVLHGLWPDGEGKDWPQYCAPTSLLPEPVVRGALCATPSPQLLQHEWAKHGTCMPGLQPADYFRRSNAMYRKLHFPPMDMLSRRPLTAGRLAAAFARENPGMPARGMRVTTSKNGWLDEVWICLDKRFRYRPCPAHQGGVTTTTRVKVWRGARQG